jgi:hypothetical protein
MALAVLASCFVAVTKTWSRKISLRYTMKMVLHLASLFGIQIALETSRSVSQVISAVAVANPDASKVIELFWRRVISSIGQRSPSELSVSKDDTCDSESEYDT